MKMNDFFTAVNYNITDGTQFLWNCFGDNSHILDSEDSDDEYHVTCVFDKKTQVVYMTEAHDYINNRAYRWINPEYKESYFDECDNKNISVSEAFCYEYGDVKFVDLEVEEDFLEKASKIVQKVPYDTNITIPLDIPDNELLKLMIMAHEQDITFNKFINNILERALNELGNNV